jgi:hypothetical protein
MILKVEMPHVRFPDPDLVAIRVPDGADVARIRDMVLEELRDMPRACWPLRHAANPIEIEADGTFVAQADGGLVIRGPLQAVLRGLFAVQAVRSGRGLVQDQWPLHRIPIPRGWKDDRHRSFCCRSLRGPSGITALLQRVSDSEVSIVFRDARGERTASIYVGRYVKDQIFRALQRAEDILRLAPVAFEGYQRLELPDQTSVYVSRISVIEVLESLLVAK